MDGPNVHPRSVVVGLPVSSSAISLVLMTLVERCPAVHTRSDVFATHPSSSAVRNGRDRYLAFLNTAICSRREHSHTPASRHRGCFKTEQFVAILPCTAQISIPFRFSPARMRVAGVEALSGVKSWDGHRSVRLPLFSSSIQVLTDDSHTHTALALRSRLTWMSSGPRTWRVTGLCS